MKDEKALVYKGVPPNICCCDSTLRILPNGEFAVFFLTGGPVEPNIDNHAAMCRSREPGVAWSKELETVFRPDEGACTFSEVYVDGDRVVMFVIAHDGNFGHWLNYTIESNDNCQTWSDPEPMPVLSRRSCIRNRYVSTWGEWYFPYQNYDLVDDWAAPLMSDEAFNCPENGVLITSDGGKTWEVSNCVVGAKQWAENNVVELSDGSMAMLIRSDGDGCLLRTDSIDRGRTWTELRRTDIPNPGSKARLHRFSDGRILLVHNPNSETNHPNTRQQANCARNPLSVWISDDDMKTWSYRRDLCDFPGMLAYPDGVLDEENNRLHIAFDYNRHDVIYWGADLS